MQRLAPAALTLLATAALTLVFAALATVPASAYLGEVTSWPPPAGSIAFDSAAHDPAGGLVYATHSDRVAVYSDAGALLRQWGGTGSAPGEFRGAVGIAASSDAVYVADAENHRVQRFTPDGALVAVWGGPSGARFERPHGLALTPAGEVLVLESERISAFSPDGSFLRSFPLRGGSEMAVGGDGSIYVAHPEGGRILKLAPDGRTIRALGRPGDSVPERDEGEFTLNGPRGVVVDSAGKIWAGDGNGFRIQRFSASGRFEQACGRADRRDRQFFDVGPKPLASVGSGRLLVAAGAMRVIGDVAPPAPSCDATAPHAAGLRVVLPRRFRAPRRGRSLPARVVVRLTLDEAARVTASVVSSRCSATAARRCGRTRKLALRAGRNRVRLRTLVGQFRARPGRYRLLLTLRDETGNQRRLSTLFRVRSSRR